MIQKLTCRGRRVWGLSALFIFMIACNLSDSGLIQPGPEDDVGPDVPVLEDGGEPDTPDAPDTPDEPECREGSDCDSGYCTDGVCVDESCADVTCGDNETCYRAVCYLSCEGADACDPSSRCYEGVCLPLDCSATTCESDETCYRGVCYAACSDATSCPEEGAECVEGSCVVATCTDGLQNGAETDVDCGGAECDACAQGKTCLELSDCQARVEGEWSVCDFGENSCAQVGTQERTVVSYRCGESQTCEAQDEVETRECSRTTDAEACGETVVGEWGACQGAGQQGVCSTQGQRRRVITSFACAQGSCEVVEDEEFEACVLETDAQACGTPEAGAWSACGGFSGTCDTTGTRSRTVTYFECGSGTCAERVASETEACSRATQGESCGSTTYTSWSACGGFSDTCDTTGEQTRTATDRVCNGGSCSNVTRTETQTCMRTTNGESCGSTSYTGWSACGGFSNTCDTTGEQTRTATDRVCSGGSCSNVTRTETQTCTRTTNGMSCGSTTHGSWSACSGFIGTCGEAGTRTRTVTHQRCSGGSCSTVTETETGSCSRDTDGGVCGLSVCDDWPPFGACLVEPDQCRGDQFRSCTDRRCSGGSCVDVTRSERRACDAFDGATCNNGRGCCQSGSCVDNGGGGGGHQILCELEPL
ncbi:hypothetical protein EA187_06770 [Lujinxingia sediminis]|uniref:SRCR domain-containing protein n=1 Tax=Lujinxingia sediminis TaxID=2480984 RepID=A0ABY0CUU4_9DELT|nr:hypothetical protein [Lujinxingia sediminis]RVU46831.1 hypothetical protein EA187_06770 [Lujinxingia sediminis]